MDAARKYTLQQVYCRVGCVGVCRVSMGNLQLRATAVLRDDARGSGQIHQGRQRAAMSGQYAAIDL